MNHFHFDFEKTLHATGVLLNETLRQNMGKMRLLKLLYIADRRMLERHGRLITGSQPVAMKYGPVLDSVYGLIKGEVSRSEEWQACFRSDKDSVFMEKDPGVGRLSRAEIKILKEVSQEFERVYDWDLSMKTHEFPEWKQNQPDDSCGNRPISLDDMINGVGRSEDLELIKDDLEYHNDVRKMTA